MRICIVTSSFQRYTGDYAGQHVYAQATGLSRLHEVYVIYPDNTNTTNMANEAFHRLPFPYPFKTYPMAQVRGLDMMNIFQLLTRIRHEIAAAKRKYNIELFYAFWTIPSGFICSFSCGKTPYMLNVAGADDKVFGRGGIARPIVKHALKHASKIVTLSRELKADAMTMGIKEDIISVIPSGINIEEYKPRKKADVRAELGLPDKFIIIYAGSLFKLKRIEWLIRLSAELGHSHDFLTLIIGDGPEKETLKEMSVKTGADNIRFLGHIPYNKVPTYISASNVLVLFSETEGLPSVVQEALASGIPVVATNVGGITDIVHQGMTGYVVNDENEARECIDYLINSPDILDHMGKIARLCAEKYLSHEHIFEQINDACKSVLSAQNKRNNTNNTNRIITEIPEIKPNIGIISTFPSDLVSRVVNVHSPYAGNIYVIAPKSSREDVTFYPVKYDIKGNLISQATKQVAAQLRMSIGIMKLRKKVDFWNFIGGDVFFLPILTAKALGIPVMLSIHGNLENETEFKKNAFSRLQLFLKKINCSLADRILVFSQGLKEKWDLGKYESKTVVAQSQYVDNNRFNIKTPFQQREKVIGYVGRLSPEKGILNLIKSMPMVLQKDRDVKLTIVGDGPLYTNVKKFLEADGLKDNIHLTGKIPLEQIPDYMNKFRLLVMPSYSEGLPATLLEAMACGTPVLATPVGAIDEVISGGKTGFLLSDNSREEIARGIINALNRPDSENIASEARDLIERKYSLQAIQHGYKKIILEGSLLNKRYKNIPSATGT